jgi:hypothetical protein
MILSSPLGSMHGCLQAQIQASYSHLGWNISITFNFDLRPYGAPVKIYEGGGPEINAGLVGGNMLADVEEAQNWHWITRRMWEDRLHCKRE